MEFTYNNVGNLASLIESWWKMNAGEIRNHTRPSKVLVRWKKFGGFTENIGTVWHCILERKVPWMAIEN